MNHLLIKLFLLLFFYSQAINAEQTCKDTIPASTKGHFIDNGNGTISDTSTDLIWKKCSEGLSSWNSAYNSCDGGGKISLYTWQEALEQAKSPSQNLGKNDWRVPNIKELYSLVEISCTHPAINLDFFTGRIYDHWSSSPNANDRGKRSTSWYLSSESGHIVTRDRSVKYQVRLVRSKQ